MMLPEVIVPRDLNTFCAWLSGGEEIITALSLRLRLAAARQDPAKMNFVEELRSFLASDTPTTDNGPAINTAPLRKLFQESPELFGAARERSRTPRGAPEQPNVPQGVLSAASAPALPVAGSLGTSSWKLQPARAMPNGNVFVSFWHTSGADGFYINEDREWLYVPFDPKWTEADLGRRDVRLLVNVPGETFLRAMHAFEEWVKKQIAARSQEVLGRSVTKEEIDAEGLYRSPLYSPDSYSPRLEVTLMLKSAAPYFLTTFSRVDAAGTVETLGTGALTMKRIGCVQGETETEHQWRGSRVQLRVRPEHIFAYEDKKRAGTKMFGLKYVARTCRLDMPSVRLPSVADAVAAAGVPGDAAGHPAA